MTETAAAMDDLRMLASAFRDLHTARDTLIREARKQGHSLRAIADAAGLSYETVRRICEPQQ